MKQSLNFLLALLLSITANLSCPSDLHNMVRQRDFYGIQDLLETYRSEAKHSSWSVASYKLVLEAQDDNGDTAAHLAAKLQFWEIVHLLYDHNKSIFDFKNYEGLTVFKILCPELDEVDAKHFYVRSRAGFEEK